MNESSISTALLTHTHTCHNSHVAVYATFFTRGLLDLPTLQKMPVLSMYVSLALLTVARATWPAGCAQVFAAAKSACPAGPSDAAGACITQASMQFDACNAHLRGR